MQVHPLLIPEGTQAGDYQSFIGIYDRPTGERLPVIHDPGETQKTVFEILPLRVAQS